MKALKTPNLFTKAILFVLMLNLFALLSVLVKLDRESQASAAGRSGAIQNGDCNGDGNRDISDAIGLLNWLFIGGDEPVPINLPIDGLGGALTPEQEELLSFFSLVQTPINNQGKTAPTIRIAGANLQIVNGLGTTNGLPPGEDTILCSKGNCTKTNGAGNLILGYQELREDGLNDRTGSHNVVIGTQHNYNSFGGLIVGQHNILNGPYSLVAGKDNNILGGSYASITGGTGNLVNGSGCSIGGGIGNSASGTYNFVAGGQGNTAAGTASVVVGGLNNSTAGPGRSAGGIIDMSPYMHNTVAGGKGNSAAGGATTVIGGEDVDCAEPFRTASGDLELQPTPFVIGMQQDAKQNQL